MDISTHNPFWTTQSWSVNSVLSNATWQAETPPRVGVRPDAAGVAVFQCGETDSADVIYLAWRELVWMQTCLSGRNPRPCSLQLQPRAASFPRFRDNNLTARLILTHDRQPLPHGHLLRPLLHGPSQRSFRIVQHKCHKFTFTPTTPCALVNISRAV